MYKCALLLTYNYWVKLNIVKAFQWDSCPLFLFAFSVYKVFENVAQKYDVMNDAMSLGIHRLWKDMLLHVMHPQPGVRLLDVAGGTGMTFLGVHLLHNWKPHLLWHFSFVCLFCVDSPLQATLPSVSWNMFVLSKSGRSGGWCGPRRHHHGRTFPTTTLLKKRTGPGNPGLWSVTSTRRCWKWASRKPTAWASLPVCFWLKNCLKSSK